MSRHLNLPASTSTLACCLLASCCQSVQAPCASQPLALTTAATSSFSQMGLLCVCTAWLSGCRHASVDMMWRATCDAGKVPARIDSMRRLASDLVSRQCA